MGIDMVSLSKHGALLLAKIAPFVGLTMIIAAFETEGAGNLWIGVWRIALSVALGIFVALVGAIYQNLSRRLETLEVAAKTDFLPRREYDARHGDVIRQLDRIENLVGGMRK